MKRLTLLLAFIVAFSLSVFAQGAGSTTGTSTDQTTTTTTTTTKKEHKASKASAKSEKAEAKEATLTGCIGGPNPDNLYTLTNGRHKKGVELSGSDDLSKHVGHKVKLTGSWESAAAAGEKETKAEKHEKHFKVDKIDMVSDTCTAAAAHGKGKKKATTTKTPGM
jgi:hypothetical protein